MFKRIFGGGGSGNEAAQSRGIPSQAPIVITPFPRYKALRGLTWERCFSLNRSEILSNFVAPLCSDPDADVQVRRLAYLLYVMMMQPSHRAGGTAIVSRLLSDAMTDGKKPDPKKFPRIDKIPVATNLPLGVVHYAPTVDKGATALHLYCYTVTDLLGACMSEAAHSWSKDPMQRGRTKRNYYAKIIALFSHWCLRVTGENRRPMKVGLACVSDVIVLGSCIPEVSEAPQAKGLIRQARYQDLKRRGRIEGNKRQVLDPKKLDTVLWDYGNCAETWTFALLCTLPENVLPSAFGIAVNIPSTREDTGSYNEQWERSRGRYAPLCMNCEKLMKQIVRWGKPGDKVVENFSVWKWEGPQ